MVPNQSGLVIRRFKSTSRVNIAKIFNYSLLMVGHVMYRDVNGSNSYWILEHLNLNSIKIGFQNLIRIRLDLDWIGVGFNSDPE